MPLNKVDNSFDSNDSKMIKSVEYDSSQGKGEFTEAFESASSEFNKMQKNNVKKNRKTPVKKEDDRISEDIDKDLAKELKQKNTKLIGLSKMGFDTRNVSFKKTKPDEASNDNILDILEKSNTIKVESSVEEELLADNYSDLIVLNPESDNKSSDPLIIPDKGNDLLETSEAVISDQLKVSKKLKLTDQKDIEKKDSKISRKKLSVVDLRHSEIKNTKTKHNELVIERENQKFTSESSSQLNSLSEDESKPIVVELTHIKDNFSSESKTLTTSSSSALMKQLEENVNNKIVKQSSIILKDGGSGEIKLILRPEQLGKVRIRLNLTDNKITGQIFVDSSSVKDVFEQNLQNLERAFKESGFDTASLNVSVGGDHSGDREREQRSGISKQIELIDEIIPTMISESENLIDLVV